LVERFEEGRTVLPALRRAGFPDPSDDAGRAGADRAVGDAVDARGVNRRSRLR
jgi:hypothetical protein